MHIRNIQKLATKMHKVYKNLSPPIDSDLFNVRNNPCNVRYWSYISILNANSLYHISEILSDLGPRIWNLVPGVLKELIWNLFF